MYSKKATAAAAKSLQSCPTLYDPMDCSLPGSSVHGILQARTPEWVAISFSICKSKTVLKANIYFLKRRKGMRRGGEKERHKQTNLWECLLQKPLGNWAHPGHLDPWVPWLWTLVRLCWLTSPTLVLISYQCIIIKLIFFSSKRVARGSEENVFLCVIIKTAKCILFT